MMRPLTLSVTIISAILTACGGGSSGSEPPSGTNPNVTIDAGILKGTTENGAQAFKGIPYAAAPRGNLRWLPPQPVTPWQGTRNANAFAEPCPQAQEADNGALVAMGNEDCLYLNVWTPENRAVDANLPVMFFIHGGADLFGSASESIDFVLNTSGGPAWYDGARAAARGNVVLVTLNYRLGALGFLAHSAMLPDSATGSVGNYGLLDQIAALQWVQRNIRVFGGDPARVMIFGQSAGAYNVCTILASPLAAGLFSRAAMHSGSCAIHSAALAQTNAEALVTELGCAGAADFMGCLRALPPEALVLADNAQPVGLGSFRMFPAVDGYVVTDLPIAIIQQNAHNAVPFLVGSNSEEYAHRFVGLSAAAYPATVAALVGAANLNLVLALYPLSDFPNPGAAAAAVLGDRNITCPARLYATTMATRQSAPVYRYFFRRMLSTSLREADGAYHASELLYLFQHMDGQSFDANDDDRTVQDRMLQYWTNFATSGDPNGGTMPAWPRYEGGSDPYQIIDVNPASGSQLFQQKCNMWLTL